MFFLIALTLGSNLSIVNNPIILIIADVGFGSFSLVSYGFFLSLFLFELCYQPSEFFIFILDVIDVDGFVFFRIVVVRAVRIRLLGFFLV